MVKEIDWNSIKSEYEDTLKSVREIAAEYSISHTYINKKAKKDKWIKLDSGFIKDKSLVNSSSFLSRTAIRKIKELITELGDNYSSIDEPLIIMFAQNYDMWMQLQPKIAANGMTCVSDKGGTYLSAEFNAMKSIEKTLLNLSNHFGLSLSSRKKIGIEKNNHDDDSLFSMAANMSDYDDLEV
jgi:P27 family predicted phage terminase small subunit